MTTRRLMSLIVTLLALLAPVSTAQAAHAHAAFGDAAARRGCTLTSTHHCIRGGQFCPRASYGHAGWDAVGRRYVCKGDRTHPHWMR